MFIYLTLITICSAIIQNSHAGEHTATFPVENFQPKSSLNIFEQELLDYIENHILQLGKYKEEIENTLSEILDAKNKQQPPPIDHSLNAIKNGLALAKANGDYCAGKILAKFAEKKDEPCPTVDDLIQTAGQIVTDTTDIITGTIHSFYLIFADNVTCSDLNGFRCFLAKFHQSEETVFHVIDTLTTYGKKASKLVQVYKDYFNRCRQANVMKQLHYYSACNSLYKSKTIN